MAESDTHLEEVVSIRLTLRAHFSSRSDVYISGLNLIYYVEGDPKKCFSPDVYVTLGIERGLRRVYLTWIEGKLPDIAFEVTSKKTRRRDIHDKRILYQQLGIREYVLYDPELDYLEPPFQLWRLQPNPAWRPDDALSPRQIYQAVEPDEDRTLFSQALNLKMKIVDQHVRFIVPETQELLPLPADDAEARREAEASLDFLRRRTIQESNKRIEAESRAILYAEQARLMEEEARRLEEQAQHLSDETRRLTMQARTDAEARAEAEARALAEISARAEAEARALALQDRLQQLEDLLKASSSL